VSKPDLRGFSECDRKGGPDFLCSLAAPAHFMQLFLKKAAYAIAFVSVQDTRVASYALTRLGCFSLGMFF
jgi:hypothetical protein